ncbi:MAG: zeta toxin family protein [Alphaproteobacteria bacterium]|nr:zeta toxin family protein [Alphaproteobacteria bacterium]
MNFDELKTKFTVNRSVRLDEYEEKKNYLISKDIDTVSETNNPKLIFAAGQPGAGKTALIKRIKEDYPDEGFVVIDIDEYRTIHPDFEEIKQYRNDVIVFTNSFLFDMEEDIILAATSQRKNIIYVGTLRDTDFALNFIVKHAKEKGYQIQIYAMAVNQIESLISTQERYEKQLDTNAPVVHFIDFNFHQLATSGYEATLALFEKEKIYDVIKVFVRGEKDGDLPQFTETYAPVIECIQKNRGNIVSKDVFYERLNKLLNKRELRNSSEREIQVIKDILKYLEEL